MDKKMDTFVFVVCLLAISIFISPARTTKEDAYGKKKQEKKEYKCKTGL